MGIRLAHSVCTLQNKRWHSMKVSSLDRYTSQADLEPAQGFFTAAGRPLWRLRNTANGVHSCAAPMPPPGHMRQGLRCNTPQRAFSLPDGGLVFRLPGKRLGRSAVTAGPFSGECRAAGASFSHARAPVRQKQGRSLRSDRGRSWHGCLAGLIHYFLGMA